MNIKYYNNTKKASENTYSEGMGVSYITFEQTGWTKMDIAHCICSRKKDKYNAVCLTLQVRLDAGASQQSFGGRRAYDTIGMTGQSR